MKGVSLRRQQRHSHQPSVSQGSDAPVSLVFRTHGDSLSKAAFLFCPKNFNLTNPVTATGSAAAAAVPSASSSASLSSVSGLPAQPARHGVTASPPSAGPHDGKRFTSAVSSSAAESVQTLVEAIVELRPSFSQPFHHSHGACGGGMGSSHNLSGLTAGSPLTSGTGDGTTGFLGFPAHTPSNSSVGIGSYVDLMALSSFVSPPSGGSFAGANGAEGGGMAFAPSVGASRNGESLHTSAASPRQGGAAGFNAGMLGSSSLTSIPSLSGVPNTTAGAAGAGSGAAGGSGVASGGGVAGAGELCFLMHPSGGWICRAMAFNEKEVSHANGAISVNQSLTSKCALINEVAKGKIMARILSSYQYVQERYGLSYVEVTVDNQYLGRSDMFLISEALRERILYEGEEMHVCGFRIRVREMLQEVVSTSNTAPSSAATSLVPPAFSASLPGVSASPAAVPSATATPAGVASSGGTTGTAASGVSASGNAMSIGAGAAGAAGTAAASAAGAIAHIRVGHGIVLPTTRINFQSLSPVHYILLELSREMWETTMDGRIALTLAIRKFLSELLLKQLPKHKASPLICVVFTGRLRKEFQFSRHSDVFHLLELPRDLRSNVDIVEEIRMHCEALVDRVLREVQDSAWRQLEAEARAYREAAAAPHSRASGAKGAGCRLANDGDDLDTDPHLLREREGCAAAATTSVPNQFPPASETLKRGRASAAFSAATEATFDAYVRSRQQYIESITAKSLFVHAKQSNTLEALSILLERCTHNYIDRNLTLCGHAVTVVSAGKGFYQVTNNLVQVVCARLHDTGLEKVHVVCIGRPPLHVTPLLEYTSDDDTLRSQYHLHSCVLSGVGVGARGMSGGAPTPSLPSGEAERYYETPEWMFVFFFHASLQYKSGGETVFELLPKECWLREHSVMAALESLWPTPPESQQQARQQQSRVYSASTLLSGGAAADGGEEGGSASAGADATTGMNRGGGAAAAAAMMGSCGSPSVAAGELPLPGGNPPLLIPGLGLRSYPVPEVTLPVHPHSANLLLYADGWGPGTPEPQHVVLPAGAAAGFAAASGGIGGGPSQPPVPLHLQPFFAEPFSASWTGSMSAEQAPSPTSPLCSSSGKAAAAPVSTVSKNSSPLLVRNTTTTSSFASPTAPTQGSMPRWLTGTGTLGAQVMAWQQTQLQQGLQPMLASYTLPHSSAGSALLQHARYAQPIQAFNCMPFMTAGAHSSGIWGIEVPPTSAVTWSSAQPRRSRTGVAGASGAAYHHLAAPNGNGGHHTTMVAVAASGLGGGRVSHPNSLPSYYATSGKPALHISRSFDHKTTANLEHHSLGGLEHSVRSVGSSLLGLYANAPRLQTRSLLWRDRSTSKSSMTSIVTSVAAATTAAGTDLGVSCSSAGGGLRSVQLRLEDGHVYRDVMGVAASFAFCAWYCLHASKPYQDCGGGSTAVAGTGATNAPASHAMAARQGGSGAAAAAIAVAGCSSPFTAASMARRLLQRDGQPSALAESAAGAAAESSYGDASLQPSVKSWHKAPSGTRSDAVFCGCNVVDSDLRNGYLILEITINAAVLPQSFWSPRLLLDDNCWAHLMSCFTGRDDRLTLDDELEFVSEEGTDDDALTIDGSSTDGQSSPLNGSSGRRWREEDGGGNVTSSAAAATAAAAGKETGGGTRGVPDSGGAGDDYHFQSDFRPAEVFCRSHSGITPDGRTLIIPTHNNGVHFQSSEEILLRFSPQLFVSTVDEVDEVALEQVGPTTSTVPHHHDTAAVDDEAVERRSAVSCVSRQISRNEGGETLLGGAAVEPAGRQDAFGRLQKDEKGSCSSPTGGSAAAAATAGATDDVGGEGQAPVPPHQTGAEVMQCIVESGSRNSTDSVAISRAKTAKDSTAAAPRSSNSACASGSVNIDAEAMEPAADVPSRQTAAPATEDTMTSTESLPIPKDGIARSTKSATSTSRPWPLRLRPTATVTNSPALAAGAPPPLPFRAHALPMTAVSRQGSSSIAGPPSSSPTPTTATHPAGQHPAYSTFHHDEVPLMPGTTVTVGFVQLRNSLLFAIKPINPLRHGSEEEHREDLTALSQSAESVSTATVLRRRWQWKHPDIAAEPQHLASWTRLCTCRLLPLYGSKPAYPRESFYTVSPHQYTVTSHGGSHADSAEDKRRLLEFVLQRLQQQYQIVVDSPGLAAGSQWPRADPSPNARLEMSLGHQTHTLKVGETAKTISVTRMLHRGMYSNGQVTHMLRYRYLLWNYLADEFTTREVHMEAQVGERSAFRWESLDGWLQERPKAFIPRGPDLWLRSREVAVALLPEDAANPPSYEEFCRFINYRFSVHLSTYGKVAWRPHEGGVSLDISEPMPLILPATPPLMEVALVHDNPLTFDTRNIVDRVTGRTVGFEVPVQERFTSVDISLPHEYDSHCCYFLKVSWLACAACIVVDWMGSFIANAARFHFHAVPVGCYYNSPKAESLTAHYDVEAASPDEEPALRRALVELLMTPAYHYYPDTPVLTRNCRLVHFSGLCCVIVPPSATTVAQWYQNAFVRQGSVEQLELLAQFKEAVTKARLRVADVAAGHASAAGVPPPGNGGSVNYS
ncbi:conserved hypothetical protein [Leishmania infantum JPCM5]|uniref:Vacuolar membrane-associated protein Iml1 N-terminal domain-containing protein n=2 Tax=Leishmania infantum TaxID=5671 RepID=A4HTB6_LEIIN|nr:conserved hypothetical protein [Leishmania infantum JPCM5]CAM65664.1 conserved hypothetical protein [Leishmania infantum JPCM5]|eukprot:XP_001463307.1 conserved hypothetical protein [Leishmania infantum JPCM5]